MKRKILIIVLCMFSSMMFSKDFFRHRFVELEVNVPVSLSNNTFKVFDFLQKNVVIDLRKIADEMPAQGLDAILATSPNVGLHFTIPDIMKIGINTGVEATGQIQVSKGLFNFLGYGNALYETISTSSNISSDVFAYANVTAEVDISKISVGLSPNLYVPLIHVDTGNSNISIASDETGKIAFNLLQELNIFSFASMDELSGLTSDEVKDRILKSFGFDMEGFVGYKLNDSLGFRFDYRFPIVPGKLYYNTVKSISSDLETNINELIGGNTPDLKLNYETKEVQHLTSIANRPMKFNVTAEASPLGKFLLFSLTGGVGIKNPFMVNVKVYPEYMGSIKLDFAGILTASLGTEYRNEVFKHSLTCSANVRLVELRTGVSLSSTDFIKSFQGTGLGCFVTVLVGF